MAVPRDLGGGGATHPQLCDTIRVLGRACGSTALAFSMHSHLVATSVWKYQHGQGGEAALRNVAEGELILLSTSASDWVDSNGTMRRVEGGYRVTTRKVFGSGGPAAHIIMASARFDDPDAGPQVLHFPVPTSSAGVRFANDWDTLGMRATGSNTVLLEDVFVADEAITLRRPQGEWHPALSASVTIALPCLMSAYVGVAESAATLALDTARGKSNAPHIPYVAGELRNLVAQTRFAWQAMVRNAADLEFTPTLDRADQALIGKSVCTNSAIATVEKAMELTGGRGFFRGFPLERMLRDIHGARYHPLPEKRQLAFSGTLALGRNPITGAAV